MTASFASTADLAEQKPRLIELARDVYGFVSDFDPNCGFVVGPEYVVAIDTRATPALAREMLAAIAQVTDKPVRYVFLTHYHAVRVMGASAFKGATIIASQGTLEWVLERGQADLECEVRRFPRLFRGIEEVPGLTMPELVFDSHLTLRLGERELHLSYLGRGHSHGDAVCWIPDCRVLFSGDLVENRCGVYAGDGYVGEWIDTLGRLRALGAEVMVPGRGAALQSREAVLSAIDGTQSFLSDLRDVVTRARAGGADIKACFAAAEAAMTPRYGDWPVFAHVLPFDVVRLYEELEGVRDPSLWTAERDQNLWTLLRG
ncbi:MBL fold metallo-hydrolase [Arenibaculum pallidiluteum]|uniref:MBL fold metallo-hydrolase n=1 Tax=Arenibaculum pallidiluteum TaxID=2812559 RepID=UPI001A96E1B3|nr:MBL fold metallo-hydrolase [Arenibaculum pallidiluteum]